LFAKYAFLRFDENFPKIFNSNFSFQDILKMTSVFQNLT
jgi:hypothetical protein